ncbi:PREDICTED: coiled-coil domain-containing protein 121 [Miniopterus natalensis]|uniref:coiled-coil domain-containing protein 121 n=1 Tax=Miniopterus natalensis TaxID=291302 RepID=UPI0007A71E1D|nr:PREDICTED: coiled-coil domain-containing protein 121 [Miniopterus natalensis]
MAGSWRYWDQNLSWSQESKLSVVGTALKTQGPRSIGQPGYRSTLGYCLRLRKKGVRFTVSTQGAGTRAPGDQSARAAPPRAAVPLRTNVPRRTGARLTSVRPAGGSGAPLRSTQGRIGLRCDPRACWTVQTLAEPRLQKSQTLSTHSRLLRELQASTTTSLASVALSDLLDEELNYGSKVVEDFSIPSTCYLSIISNFLKPEKPTRAAMLLMEKTVELLKLDKQIKEAQIQQKEVLEETRLLLNEKFHVQADTKFMLDHLTNKTEEYRKEINKLWDNYAQESGEIQRRRQELASKYAKQTLEFQKQILEKEKKEFDLKHQLRAMKDISLVKEKQDREMQTLQEELKKARAETIAKAYAQYLQEKALLEKQLSEPDVNLLGKREKKELKKKAKALEVVAKGLAFECCCDILRENQGLHKDLAQQSQHCQELQATQRHLQNQKHQLQQEQWYTECLIRGRQRLQQGAPKAIRIPSFGHKGTKSRINPQ